MAAFGIHELRKQTEEEFPDASFDDTFGGTRDRVVGAVKDANIGERVGEQASKLRLPEVRRPGARGRRARRRPRRCRSAMRTPASQRLERLGALREKGILTEEEFAAEKARLLGGDDAP